MTPPVIEDTTAANSWRRRVAGAWTAAIATVAGGIAAVGSLAWWQVSLATDPAAWGMVGGAVAAGVLARAGWVRWIRPRSGWRPAWQDGLPYAARSPVGLGPTAATLVELEGRDQRIRDNGGLCPAGDSGGGGG